MQMCRPHPLCDMSTEISIFFLRHGRSSGDDEGVHEGRYDAELTKIGRAQAITRATAWQAAGIRFDRILASTLRRAHDTAQIMAQAFQAPLDTDPDWMEVDNGVLAGLPFEVADQQYPWPAFRNPYELFFDSGESDWELHCRAIRAVQKIIRRGAGQYLVVAHGGILNAALRHIVGAPPPINGPIHGHGVYFALGDTGYAQAVYYPEKHQWLLGELRPEYQTYVGK